MTKTLEELVHVWPQGSMTLLSACFKVKPQFNAILLLPLSATSPLLARASVQSSPGLRYTLVRDMLGTCTGYRLCVCVLCVRARGHVPCVFTSPLHKLVRIVQGASVCRVLDRIERQAELGGLEAGGILQNLLLKSRKFVKHGLRMAFFVRALVDTNRSAL